MNDTVNTATDAATDFPADAVLKLRVDRNPKRPGTENHKRFAAMMKRMREGSGVCTVEEARGAGVTLGDLRFNASHGYVTVERPKGKASRAGRRRIEARSSS